MTLSISSRRQRLFQSTLPARGATCGHGKYCRTEQISIHAPRTGSDCYVLLLLQQRAHFNPRSPHGERRLIMYIDQWLSLFQSTLPARGATDSVTRSQLIFANFNPRSPHGERLDAVTSITVGSWISIHAPRTGSDGNIIHAISSRNNFNPRSPHGERLEVLCTPPANFNISIHAPRTGSDHASMCRKA